MADKNLHILFASAEAVPFSKVGGLGDVVGSLPQAIKRLDPKSLDIRLILPFHSYTKEQNLPIRKMGGFSFIANGQQIFCDIFISRNGDVPVYLLDNDQINHNSPIYYGDWNLDGMKYATFSLAILEAAKWLGWKVDILHAHDWHTALALHALRTTYRDDPFFAETRTVISIHNLPFNGHGSQQAMSTLGFIPSVDPDLPDWARFTPLPLGIAAADKIIPVSEGYAREILTHQFGCGMEAYFNAHIDKIQGITNGIDPSLWDPETDQALPHPYSANSLEGKLLIKAEFQQHAGFDVNPVIPLLTVVSRIDYQKGIDLIRKGLPLLMDQPWQLAILGSGNTELENQIRALASDHPRRIAAFIKYDDSLARLLYASGDIFLMPSLYEPCGLSQMIAMRYGNIPLATATGGLQDTIIDVQTSPENGTGFLFTDKSVEGFTTALKTVLARFSEPSDWVQIMINAMRHDFSWQKPAAKYLQIYQNLLNFQPER